MEFDDSQKYAAAALFTLSLHRTQVRIIPVSLAMYPPYLCHAFSRPCYL